MAIPFRARARTIDHLGREQIADCPTAISELWKNAYDAYAREVALHIFDGEVPIAAVVDDGHGMDLDDFVDKWLIIGTESKLTDAEVPEVDRNGLELRPRQGKKGIGRLSVASLGPVCLVISKRRHKPFVAAMLDWRLFENPYLILDDVMIPVEEFDSADDVAEVVANLFDELVDNVWVKDADPEDKAREARKARVEDAWRRWDAQNDKDPVPPSERIARTALSASLADRHFDVFPALRGDAECGTTLYVLDINHELAVWVDPNTVEADDEVGDIKGRLMFTLRGFVDPFSLNTSEFAYQVDVHRDHGEITPVTDQEKFGRDDLLELEHYVEGNFDRYGIFQGTVRAFSREPFTFELTPQRPPPQRGTGYVGPFKLCIGTYEVDPGSSTHSREHHQHIKRQAERFSGLAMYRSGLRVMPYGRPDWDYFGMEERRSQHAGRNFWAHRRSFGRVAISYEENPNLRDKAGREGLIDNKARRELRLLVIGVLKETARRYFGTDAKLRDKLLPEIRATNKAEQSARDAVKQRKKVFRDALKRQQSKLEETVSQAETLAHDIAQVFDADEVSDDVLQELGARLDEAMGELSSLRLPRKPARLGRTEAAYRKYRDRYDALSQILAEAHGRWAEGNEARSKLQPGEQARRAIIRHRAFLTKTIRAYKKEIIRMLESENSRITGEAAKDEERYYQRTAKFHEDVENQRTPLATALRLLEEERRAIHDDIKARYESYIEALKQLAADADLSGAVVWSEERREEFEGKMEQVYSLAQLGIAGEIIGHELNSLDTEIDRNLRRMPAEVQQTAPYRAVFQAHQSLMERLAFLAPLRMAGPRLKERIRGEDIHEYLRDFFRDRIKQQKIRFEATERFRNFSVVEHPYRIYPVFINLLNNALYWLTFVEDRRMVLDRIEGDVIVADSGPGADKDDIPHLFELFFSRRADGRGVGLYLCRANLHAGQHEIEYVEDPNRKILPGANFVLRFKGIDYE